MELHLQRTYHATGTNGVVTLDHQIVCYTIELPWRNNRTGLSCIPEGRYRLEARWSHRFEDHLHVRLVPGRTLILLHPANSALEELKGCIAPVSNLTGPGKGEQSGAACMLIKRLVYRALQGRERVWLVIGS